MFKALSRAVGQCGVGAKHAKDFAWGSGLGLTFFQGPGYTCGVGPNHALLPG